MKLSQSAFASRLADALGIGEVKSNQFLNLFKKEIYSCLQHGDTVELSGFGQFSVSHREPREGINPRTLQRMTIPELNTPKFRAGEAFKNAVALQ